MEIKISVVIPTYNREKTIKRCIFSILKQTQKPFEIIVVDDGSTDRTTELVESLNDESIRLIRQNHKGAQVARNMGILNARGNYIAFLDSDDEWMPNCVETYLKCLADGNENKVLFADCYVLNEVKNETKIWRLPGKSGNVYGFLLAQAGPMFQGMLAPKDALIKAGLLDEHVVAFQEWDTAIALSKENRFVHIKRPLFIYHMHEGDTISKSKKAGIEGYDYIVTKYKNEIVRKNGYYCLCQHYRALIGQSKGQQGIYKIKFGVIYRFLALSAFLQHVICWVAKNLIAKNSF